MRFCVGDLVEVIGASRFHDWVGRELIVAAVDHEFRSVETGEWRSDGVLCIPIADYGLWAPEHLRLRRPPSWDSWLYDTRSVEHERDLSKAMEAQK